MLRVLFSDSCVERERIELALEVPRVLEAATFRRGLLTDVRDRQIRDWWAVTARNPVRECHTSAGRDEHGRRGDRSGLEVHRSIARRNSLHDVALCCWRQH